MLKKVFQNIASRGTVFGWKTLKGFKNARFIGHSGWMFEQFNDKNPEGMKDILRKKYLDKDFVNKVIGKGKVLPSELLTSVVTPEGAFCGVMPVDLPGSDDPPGNIKFPGSNALPESWIPDIIEVLQEVCKHYESLSDPGRKFLLAVTSTFFHHDADGKHLTVEQDGKIFKLASNVAITVTADTFALVNKWEADPADNMGEYVLKSDWERLTGAIKKEMEAKVHLLSGQTDGFRGAVSLICRDITQVHTLRLDGLKPDAVLFYFPTNGHPAWSALKTPSDCRFILYMCEGKEGLLQNTGLYQVVRDAGEWRMLKENVALGRSREFVNLTSAAWDMMTGAKATTTEKRLIDLKEGEGGIIKHIIPSERTGSRENWVSETEVFEICDKPPKEDQYGSLIQVWKERAEKGNKDDDGARHAQKESEAKKSGVGHEKGNQDEHSGQHGRPEERHKRLEEKHRHKDGRKW